jgi:hypothetical protein
MEQTLILIIGAIGGLAIFSIQYLWRKFWTWKNR